MHADRHILIEGNLYNVINYTRPHLTVPEILLCIVPGYRPQMPYSFVLVEKSKPKIKYKIRFLSDFCIGYNGTFVFPKSFEQWKGIDSYKTFSNNIPDQYSYLSYTWLKENYFMKDVPGIMHSVTYADKCGILISLTCPYDGRLRRECILYDYKGDVRQVKINHNDDEWPRRIHVTNEFIVMRVGDYSGGDMHAYVWPIDQLEHNSMNIDDAYCSINIKAYGNEVVALSKTMIMVINNIKGRIYCIDMTNGKCMDEMQLCTSNYMGHTILSL